MPCAGAVGKTVVTFVRHDKKLYFNITKQHLQLVELLENIGMIKTGPDLQQYEKKIYKIYCIIVFGCIIV